jgi:hypothetical protein
VVAVVVFNIKEKLSDEKSSLRKEFYTSVIKVNKSFYITNCNKASNNFILINNPKLLK